MTNKLGYFVYFIESSSGVIKIGKSTNPWRRVNALQTANYDKLELLKIFALNSEEEMNELEIKFHKYFSSAKIKNEWFDASIVKDWLHNIHKLPGVKFGDLELTTEELNDYLEYHAMRENLKLQQRIDKTMENFFL